MGLLYSTLVLSLGLVTIVCAADLGNLYYAPLHRCPAPCTNSLQSANWTVYNSMDRLSWCDKAMLLDFAIYVPFEDKMSRVAISACTAKFSTVDGDGADTCGPANQTTGYLQSGPMGTGSDAVDAADAITAARQVSGWLKNATTCNTKFAFA
jgi:hypothetical protein